MGYKSRGNWHIGACLKRCANRGDLCKECIRFSKFEAYFYDTCAELDKILKETNEQEEKDVQ